MKMSNLYVLVFQQGDYIKIGKADDIHARIAVLQRVWGPVDYAASYYISAPVIAVRQVESALLSLLAQFALSVPEGDGRTELRAKPALPIALQYLEVYCASMPGLGGIQMGVSLPPRGAPSRRRVRRDQLLRKSRCMSRSLRAMDEKFQRINRLLTVMYRRQARIPFECEQNGSTITFRVRKPVPLTSMDAESRAVMDYFHFEMEDSHGSGGFTCCSVAGVGDVVQFTINLPNSFVKQWAPVIGYFVDHSLAFFNRLPSRSAAASIPIPPLH